MDKEKMFELAAQLVAANVGAGQFNNAMNFETIVSDQVPLAFRALRSAWEEWEGESVH